MDAIWNRVVVAEVATMCKGEAMQTKTPNIWKRRPLRLAFLSFLRFLHFPRRIGLAAGHPLLRRIDQRILRNSQHFERNEGK